MNGFLSNEKEIMSTVQHSVGGQCLRVHTNYCRTRLWYPVRLAMNTVIVSWLILYQTPPSHKKKWVLWVSPLS